MRCFKIAALCGALLWIFPAHGQIRNVAINSASEEGKLLQQASDQNDPAKKIAVLEEFLAKYPSHEAIGYVHLQLQNEYLKTNNFDKSIEQGRALQAKAPEDLETAYLLVKAAQGKGDAQQLIAQVLATHALAQKAAAAPKPSAENEAEAWKTSVDFAAQVDQYNQYALYESSQKQATPQAKVLLFDALRKNFPGGQFDKSLDGQYVTAYQQLGDTQKMGQAAQAVLATDPTNEAYLYLAAEANLDPGKGKPEVAQAAGQKILEVLPNKPKPANVADDEWAKSKANYLGLAHSVIGRSLANQGKFPDAQKELLVAVAALKGNDQALAPALFFLGFCSAKLERRRDAVTYLSEASKIPGPYQAAAADLLTKIQAAPGGKATKK